MSLNKKYSSQLANYQNIQISDQDLIVATDTTIYNRRTPEKRLNGSPPNPKLLYM